MTLSLFSEETPTEIDPSFELEKDDFFFEILNNIFVGNRVMSRRKDIIKTFNIHYIIDFSENKVIHVEDESIIHCNICVESFHDTRNNLGSLLGKIIREGCRAFLILDKSIYDEITCHPEWCTCDFIRNLTEF